MTLLTLDRVSKRFSGVAAVRGLSLEVHDGEILGLIGPNGSGKTTLFNLITGYYRLDDGRVELRGRDISRASPPDVCRLGIARTFQLVRPFQHLTVVENVAVGRAFGRQPARDLRRALLEAGELLEQVGLSGRASAPAHSLTLINRKRLELGRALAA